MTDDIWKRDEIASPCVKLCTIHPEAKICLGCYRTLEEIGTWSRLTPQARSDIMDDLPNRAPLLKKRRGGRAARVTR